MQAQLWPTWQLVSSLCISYFSIKDFQVFRFLNPLRKGYADRGGNICDGIIQFSTSAVKNLLTTPLPGYENTKRRHGICSDEYSLNFIFACLHLFLVWRSLALSVSSNVPTYIFQYVDYLLGTNPPVYSFNLPIFWFCIRKHNTFQHAPNQTRTI